MHYQLEVIMPPTDDVQAALTEILAPFDENDDHDTRHAFWDYWKIGGRWSGNKMLAVLGEKRVDAFYELVRERKITVSPLQFGKPTLQPADQAGLVDMLWRDAFPDAPVAVCPLFDHYKGDWGDVMPLKDAPRMMKCSHLIIAAPDYKNEKLEAIYMTQKSVWNGVTHVQAAWDGTIEAALKEHADRLEGSKPEWAVKHTPKADWLVVTVDYHS